MEFYFFVNFYTKVAYQFNSAAGKLRPAMYFRLQTHYLKIIEKSFCDKFKLFKITAGYGRLFLHSLYCLM